MTKPIIEIRYYESYYFANILHNILNDQFTYIKSLNDFYGDGEYLNFVKPFPRFSAFHSFLEFVIDELLIDSTEHIDLNKRRLTAENFKSIPSAIADLDPYTLPIEAALKFHGLEYESFIDWLRNEGKEFSDADSDDVYEFVNDLRICGPYGDLLDLVVREVFFILFGNRQALMMFNDMMASQISGTLTDEIPEEYSAYFSRAGVLKRVRIPEWVRRAVFYRDRGMCVKCRKDLSGLLSIWSDEHFDHIVPLTCGGLNDVTNIQLLCSTCNLQKGGRKIATSNIYEDWYPLSDIC